MSIDGLPPWVEMLSVWVDGLPKGQPRGRAFVAGGQPRIFTPGTAESWKGDIARAVEPHRPPQPLREPVRLDLDVYLPRPKRLMRKKDPRGPVRFDGRPDVDNIFKAVADALEALGMYDDDKRITETLTRCYYHSKTGRPGARLRLLVEKKGLF